MISAPFPVCPDLELHVYFHVYFHVYYMCISLYFQETVSPETAGTLSALPL